LTPAADDAAKLACKACGISFGVRPKKAAVAAANAASRPPANAFAGLADAPETPRKAASASEAKSRPAAAGDPRLRLALLVGAGLAVVFLAMIGAVVLVVVLAARTAQPTPVAVAPVNLPPSPVASDPASDPAPPPAHKDVPAPTPAPKKPTPPKDDPPPVTPTPPPAGSPAADPAPPDLKPAPEPKPMPDPMPAPEVKPAADPINQAIDKAVVYLKKEAMGGGGGGPVGLGAARAGFGLMGGNQVGVMGLIGLALMESGVPTDDPAVVAAVTAVRDGAPTCGNTYEMAIAVWCLDRLGDPKDEDLIRDLAARLIAGQLDHGKWTYNCPQGGAGAGPAPVPGFNRPAAPLGLGFNMPGMELSADQIKELMATLTKYEPSAVIPAKKQIAPVCRFVRGKKVEAVQAGNPLLAFGGGDLSLTQFAVLGLWVARKHHVPVDRSLLLAESYARGSQAGDGGWAYSGLGLGTTDAMTCSGMMELAIGRGVGHAEGAKAAGTDPQFEKGLIYLADLFTRGVSQKQKDVKADPKEVQNLAGVSNRLQAQFGPLMMHGLLNQHALWLRELTAFQAEVDKALALDLPADAKKELQAITNQIKAYKDAPAEKKKKEKEGLDQLLQQSTVLQPFGGMKGFGFVGGMGRLLRPGKFNRMNMDDIYCLWSLERLCMVCDLKTVAGRDWYAWGAELLVDSQNDDGSWASAGICGTQVDTCLAVLFLKRVNVAKDLTAQLRLVAPIKDLPPEELKFIAPGTSPSPGEAQPTLPPAPLAETPKP